MVLDDEADPGRVLKFVHYLQKYPDDRKGLRILVYSLVNPDSTQVLNDLLTLAPHADRAHFRQGDL